MIYSPIGSREALSPVAIFGPKRGQIFLNRLTNKHKIAVFKIGKCWRTVLVPSTVICHLVFVIYYPFSNHISSYHVWEHVHWQELTFEFCSVCGRTLLKLNTKHYDNFKPIAFNTPRIHRRIYLRLFKQTKQTIYLVLFYLLFISNCQGILI